MPNVYLSICTYGLPLDSYVDYVLKHLKELFDIKIDDEWPHDETGIYRYFRISTDCHPFEIKRECMRLENRSHKRISDIDIDVIHGTAEGGYRKEKISRRSGSFINWRIRKYFEKILDQLCDLYLLSRD